MEYLKGIVDAQPNPKFAWYFDDEPVIPGMIDNSNPAGPSLTLT